MPGLTGLLFLYGLLPARADDPPSTPSVPVPEVKEQVAPEYPKVAKLLELEQVTCLAHFFIDEKGVPYEVEVTGCPEVFHPSLQVAGRQWRFSKVRDKDGRRAPSEYLLNVTYRLGEEPVTEPAGPAPAEPAPAP